MAIKPYRVVLDTDITHFMNSVAEAGGVLCVSSTTASGVATDQSELTVEYKADASGAKPVGLLLNDVVNKDLTQQRLAYEKDEVQVGSKVTVLRKGEVVTDRIYPGHSPSPGGYAYVGHSGYIAASDVATDDGDSTGTTRIIGRFVTGKDQDGYCRVAVNLP